MLKNLLVHIPSERLVRPVVDSAVSLAVSHAAHLNAISVGYENTNVGLAVDVGGGAVAAVFEIERQRALARANAALAVFETEARNAKSETAFEESERRATAHCSRRGGCLFEVKDQQSMPFVTAA